MKTLNSLINEAEYKMELWKIVAEDEHALVDRNKTREEAMMLSNFFEGRFDALLDVKGMVKEEYK